MDENTLEALRQLINRSTLEALHQSIQHWEEICNLIEDGKYVDAYDSLGSDSCSLCKSLITH